MTELARLSVENSVVARSTFLYFLLVSNANSPRHFLELSTTQIPDSLTRTLQMLALSMPVMGFVPTIVPRSAPVRMQVRRTRA